MLKKLLPVVLLLIGTGAGVGAGIFLRPTPQGNLPEVENAIPVDKKDSAETEQTFDYVKLSNQFVVPVVKDKKVTGLIVMSLSLEVPEAQRSNVFRHEPKLRDSFLQVLFDHANFGGFDGVFTATKNLDPLRLALTEVGQAALGENVINDVLITEIARQDY